MPSQKASVESCIRVLSDVGKKPILIYWLINQFYTCCNLNRLSGLWQPFPKHIIVQDVQYLNT